MQITETSNEGLKRTLKVVVGADELGRRFTERLGAMKDRVQLKGFRKGKVPEPHLRKMFGRSRPMIDSIAIRASPIALRRGRIGCTASRRLD